MNLIQKSKIFTQKDQRNFASETVKLNSKIRVKLPA